MQIVNRQVSQTRLTEQLKTSSILPFVPAKYPTWLDELFLRFAVIYEGRWTHSIQDPKMLELKKAEWFETLGEFDAQIIMETIANVKKLPGDFPSLQKCYEIAAAKRRHRKTLREMDQRDKAIKLEHKYDPEVAERRREELKILIRKLKSTNR